MVRGAADWYSGNGSAWIYCLKGGSVIDRGSVQCLQTHLEVQGCRQCGIKPILQKAKSNKAAFTT